MLRQARAVFAQWAHRVMQRGNNRQDVFFVDAAGNGTMFFARKWYNELFRFGGPMFGSDRVGQGDVAT